MSSLYPFHAPFAIGFLVFVAVFVFAHSRERRP